MSNSSKSAVETTVATPAVKEGSVDKAVKAVALADSKGRKIIYINIDGQMFHVQVPNWFRETLELKKPFDLTVVPCANGKWYNAVGLVNPNAKEKAASKKSSGMSKKTQDEILAILNSAAGNSGAESEGEAGTLGI